MLINYTDDVAVNLHTIDDILVVTGLSAIYVYKLTNSMISRCRKISLNNKQGAVPRLGLIPSTATDDGSSRLLFVVVDTKIRFVKISQRPFNAEVLVDVQVETDILDMRAINENSFLIITELNQVRLLMLSSMSFRPTLFKPFELSDTINYKVSTLEHKSHPMFDTTFLNCELIRHKQYGAACLSK